MSSYWLLSSRAKHDAHPSWNLTILRRTESFSSRFAPDTSQPLPEEKEKTDRTWRPYSLDPPHNSVTVTTTIRQRQDRRSDLNLFSSGRRIHPDTDRTRTPGVNGASVSGAQAREPSARRRVCLNMYAKYTHKACSHRVTNTCIMDGGVEGGHIICVSFQCQVCIHEMRSPAASQYLFVYADAAVTKSFLRPEQTQRALDFPLSPCRRGVFEHLAG